MKKTILFFAVAMLFCGTVRIHSQGNIIYVDVNSPANPNQQDGTSSGGSFSVSSKSGSRIFIRDMQGRCVLKTISSGDRTVLQAPKYGGVYVVNIIDETATPQTVRLIVQ